MPNNFEKQVQQKMDELRFAPTAPVWEQIEKQIRAKKDRRRLIIWLPLIVLLTGTGIWLLRNENIGKVGDVVIQKTERQTVINHDPVAGKAVPHTKIATPIEENISSSIREIPTSQKIVDRIAADAKKSGEAGRIKGHATADSNKDMSGDYTADAVMSGTLVIENGESVIEHLIPERYISQHLMEMPVFTFWKDSVERRTLVPGNNVLDDSSIVSDKKAKASHWEAGIAAGAGYSGVSKSFDVIPAALQADAGSVTGSYNSSNGYKSSPVNKHIAFSIGARFKKDISSRTSFALGIDYRFYSTSIKVGQERFQDTIVATNRSINSFYMGYGANLQDYSNQFHFIALPVSLEWKVGDRLPVYLEASFAINQMIYTNGLVFDGRTGIYYSDKKAYNKTQLMTGLGLSYELLKRKLFIGPLAQYGIRKMESRSTSNHLVYAGLQARYFFEK